MFVCIVQDAQNALKQSQSQIAAIRADLDQVKHEDQSVKVVETIQLETSLAQEARAAKKVIRPGVISCIHCAVCLLVLHCWCCTPCASCLQHACIASLE